MRLSESRSTLRGFEPGLEGAAYPGVDLGLPGGANDDGADGSAGHSVGFAFTFALGGQEKGMMWSRSVKMVRDPLLA